MPDQNEITSALTKKVGPLPAWAWAAVGGGALYFYRKHEASTTAATTAATTTTTQPQWNGEGNWSGSGGTDGGGSGSGDVTPTTTTTAGTPTPSGTGTFASDLAAALAGLPLGSTTNNYAASAVVPAPVTPVTAAAKPKVTAAQSAIGNSVKGGAQAVAGNIVSDNATPVVRSAATARTGNGGRVASVVGTRALPAATPKPRAAPPAPAPTVQGRGGAQAVNPSVVTPVKQRPVAVSTPKAPPPPPAPKKTTASRTKKK